MRLLPSSKARGRACSLSHPARQILLVLLAVLAVAGTSAADDDRPRFPSTSKVKPPFGRKAPKPEATPAPEPVESPAAASAPAASPAPAAPGTALALVTVPPLPAGAEMTYTPMQQSGMPPADPAQVAREKQQRAQKLVDDLKTVGPIQNLPSPGTAEFTQLRAQAIGIVQRRFQESRAALEADATADYTARVTWTPNFSASPRSVAPADRERASAISYDVAFAVTHLNRPRFIIAYAAAVFALDPDSALGAENAASAIVTGGERMYPSATDNPQLQRYRADAEVVYRYALARSVDGGKWTLRSLGVLINLGNLYVDMKAPDRARPVLLAAKLYAPDSFDAALALAACYEMQGRSGLARAALEDNHLARSAMYATVARGSKNLDEVRQSGDLTPDKPDEEIEAVLQKFDAQVFLTAADFIEQIDPSERERMRRFVNDLPVQGNYRAPDIEGLTQFSTVASINKPDGYDALGQFGSRVGSYGFLLLGSMRQQSNDALARMGMSVTYDVDINDVIAHPEKYEGRKLNATVTGADQAMARAQAMRRQAKQAQRELAMGKTDTHLSMGAAVDPVLAVYRLKPYDYANPMDVMIQQYNASMLGQKLHAYNTYFYSVNGRTRKLLGEIADLHAKKIATIRAQEAAEMDAFRKRREAAQWAGQNTHTAHWRLLEHNIHKRFIPQYNDQTGIAWKEATQVAVIAYERKIKRRAERFYRDVFRHVALISDPHAREKKNQEVERMLHWAVYQGLLNVVTAFGSYEYVEEWDCGCDVGSLHAQAEQEARELERIRFEDERRARLQFASGDIPPASPLFRKLDAYGTDLEIPFIPFMTGRISAARTTLKLEAQLPIPLSPKVEYTFTENAFTGATTHGGSLEVGAAAKEGDVSIAATLNVKGSVTLDGRGVVSDYSVTGASNVKVGVGPTTASLGGEIGYTPTGGMTSDVTAGITTSISDAYGKTVTVSLVASARRGSTFTAKAEMNLNPYSSELNGFLKETMDESVGDMNPFSSTAIPLELWNGKFTF
ncbi:MAG: hypothetical protein JXB05_31250 [Myxococcaceae bacterium]|nr:hypothetical protein [Myxococcaceae bacterium]